MFSPRIKPATLALVLVISLALLIPAPCLASSPTDSTSLIIHSLAFSSHSEDDCSEESISPDQLQEIADYFFDRMTETVVSLMLTMETSPWTIQQVLNEPADIAGEDLVSMIVQPPLVPADISGGDGGNGIPQSHDSPEPGTLITTLAGAGVLLVRYFRRRRVEGPTHASPEAIPA